MILKNKKGFTLVELLVVIAIVGILAVIAVPSLYNNILKAQIVELKSDMRSFKFAVESFYVEKGQMPHESDWEDWMTDNIDTNFEKTLENGETLYEFGSGYKYRFDFIKDINDENKIVGMYIGGFQLNQNMVNLIKRDDVKAEVNKDSENSNVIVSQDQFKDEFFEKYNGFIYENGTIWMRIDECK